MYVLTSGDLICITGGIHKFIIIVIIKSLVSMVFFGNVPEKYVTIVIGVCLFLGQNS